MAKVLVFYRVDNPLGFDRHSFDNMDDDEAYKELMKLVKYEDDHNDDFDDDFNGFIRIFDTMHLADFQDDFNDEVLDDGWWCILLNVSE